MKSMKKVALLLLAGATLSGPALADDMVDLVAQRKQQAPAPSLSIQKRWAVTRDEITLSVPLRRWAKEAGYDLVWSAPKELPAYPLVTTGTFDEAMQRIMLDTKSTSYPMRTCIYLNNVVRIVQAAQSCTR
ncbi:TcpQ domain-containing protein [Cupriavidus basilensis]